MLNGETFIIILCMDGKKKMEDGKEGNNKIKERK